MIANCGWLMVPVMAINLALMKRLPRKYQTELFSRGVPAWLRVGENVSRAIVFALPFLMPLKWDTAQARAGLALYAVGLGLYFLSWAMQLWWTDSTWSRSRLGFMAPSYTPAVWLLGITLVGERWWLPAPYSPWAYAAVAASFLAFHNLHTWGVYHAPT